MWNRPANWTWILASILAAPAASSVAADATAPAEGDKNHLSLNTRIGLNIGARFSQVGTIRPAHSPGGTGSALDHFYEDGYVRVDSSGNAGGQTWFWGYDNSSQISGNNILFHSTHSQSASPPREINDDPQLGFDLVYNRELGSFGDNNDHHYGLEMSFGWIDIGIQDNGTARANVTRVTDSFGYTPGTTPPAAPFRGTFAGPNFTLFDTPTRTSQSISGAQVLGRRELDGDLFIGHIGPYAEFALTDKLQLLISGGLALGGIYTEFDWNESVRVAGASTLHRHASGDKSDFLIGGYLGAKLGYQFNPRWRANLGLQFEGLSDYAQTVAGHKASLDLNHSFYLSIGVAYSF